MLEMKDGDREKGRNTSEREGERVLWDDHTGIEMLEEEKMRRGKKERKESEASPEIHLDISRYLTSAQEH